MVNYIVGLGGRVVTLKDLKALTTQAVEETAEGKIDKPVQWVGVRGLE
jgi:hypothetical protein